MGISTENENSDVANITEDVAQQDLLPSGVKHSITVQVSFTVASGLQDTCGRLASRFLASLSLQENMNGTLNF